MQYRILVCPCAKKIIRGISKLVFSIVSMMIAFNCAFLLMLCSQSWIIISAATVPTILFILLQLSLLLRMTFQPTNLIGNRSLIDRFQFSNWYMLGTC